MRTAQRTTKNRRSTGVVTAHTRRRTAAEEFEVLSASVGVRTGQCGSLAELAEQVEAADHAAGRLTYRLAGTEIVQIQPPASRGPRYFVHYTPDRARRPQHPSGCPICLGQVRASGQNYALIRLGDWRLTVLANPFAYMPRCVTWASTEDLPQACSLGEGPGSWRSVFRLMLLLCLRLDGHVVGFNERAGNSLDHLHLVSHLPVDGLGLYGAQQCAAHLSRRAKCAVAQVGTQHGYPVDFWRIALPDAGAAATAAASLMAAWKSVGGPFASANCAAAMENGSPALYIFPRSTLLSARGWRSTPAFMEMLGVFIASDPGEMASVRSGELDHRHFSAVLSSLRPPLLDSCEALTASTRGAGLIAPASIFHCVSESEGDRSAPDRR
jgi:hypothetical protein